MGDNIESKMNETNNVNNISSNNISVNSQDVNMTLNKATSSNSISVSDRIKLLNKTASFTSETSVKSTKSTKSEKGKKKNKVKNMIKKLEKHIIYGGKKERNDNISIEINNIPIEQYKELQEPTLIQEEKITEVEKEDIVEIEKEIAEGEDEKIDNQSNKINVSEEVLPESEKDILIEEINENVNEELSNDKMDVVEVAEEGTFEENVENIEEESLEEKVEEVKVIEEENSEEKVEEVKVVEEESLEEKVEEVKVIEEENSEEKVEEVKVVEEESLEEKVEEVKVIEEENSEEKVEEVKVIEEENSEDIVEEKEETVEEKVDVGENIEEKDETIENIENIEEKIEDGEEKQEQSEEINKDERLVEEKEIIDVDDKVKETQEEEENDYVSEIMKKGSIISQLSQVIVTGSDSISEHESSLIINESNISEIDNESNQNIENVENENNMSEIEAKDTSIDDSYAAEEELNEFSNALKSINDINNAEKQFLISNSDAIEKMINKSLKNNNEIELLNHSSPQESLETKSVSNKGQSGANLHLKIAPPQPPPATPLPPTPQVPVPPQFSLGGTKEDDNQSILSKENEKSKGHLQHLSLGRLTEVINIDEEEDQQKRQSSTSLTTDNSTPLNSNVQTVTIQSVNESDSIKIKRKSNNNQPLQAIVYNFDSEDDVSTKEDSGNDQSLKAEVQSVEEKEESNSINKPVEEKEEDENKETKKTNSLKDEINNKAEAFKTSSKKLKDTFSNIENLLEDLDNQIQSFKTPKLKSVDPTIDGYEGDDETRRMRNKSNNKRNQLLTNSLFIENPNPDMNNLNQRPVSSYTRQSYYTESVMSDDPDILPLPAVIEGGPMSPESVHDITIQSALHPPLVGNNNIIPMYNMDDDFDIDQSLNNNLKILKSSVNPSSMISKKNPAPSPVISTKALKLVGVENHSISNMSAKALKMLGMNAPDERDEFANFQFDERELAMLNAAPITSPHIMNKGHGRNGSSSSKPQTEDYMPVYPSHEMGRNMNERPMSLEEIEEVENLLNDDNDDLTRDPSMLTMGSIKSNNSFNSVGNNSFAMSQKVKKVFGLSEYEFSMMNNMNNMNNMNGMNNRNTMSSMNSMNSLNNEMNPMSPRTPNVGISSPHQQFSLPVDNLNLSRYSINDGENQVNGIISSKALKIIGLEDTTSSSPPPPTPTTPLKKPDYIDGKKNAKSSKREKMKEFEEVKEVNRNLTPTLASLKPILTDNLYYSTHGILKGWKRRFTVLTQDSWIYCFVSNDPKNHAIIAVPINSNTIVKEYFDPINIVPYFVEIISKPEDSDSKRYIIIGCDNKQKCQSWVTSIKSLVARDKFSNAKLPPKPNSMEEDLDIGNVSIINPNPVNSPLYNNTNFSNGRPHSLYNKGMSGDLGSLYDDVTGYNSSMAPSGIERSHTYGEKPVTSPLMVPINGQANVVKKPQVKNIRITKHPVRKESFKPHYSNMNMIKSPNLSAMNGSRTPRMNSQSMIPMVSSTPLLKGQYSPYSPVTKPLNDFSLTSPTLPPMSLPSTSHSPSIIATPKSIGGPTYRRSPLLGAETIGMPSTGMASPLLSPKQKSINMISSPYLGGYNPNQYNPMMNPMEDMMDYESVQQQRMFQQEELIKQQQQQILQLQKQLLKNQQEMEQGIVMDMPKDKNY
ncbi:hypothetical protein BCR36DRAFT_588074 [Piromyces finnis]|uniref:PH domain-containing protein n=1 Tax=Piromyces finnis TaxID=1754191 RepID=A0A1Y1UTP0_9FUNG|nr:hypothetical protein BCR36DRAFT_588074 [Piromyces finnis]|eukprot:ORX41381.1 hypothetical protein BCR36DRAFT_588074 [Piromyces finnis]